MSADPSTTSVVRFVVACSCCLGLLLASCEERGVTEREVPKGNERIAGVAGSDAAAEAANPDAGAATPPWSVPEGWRRVQEQAPMRLATFVAEQPEGQAKVLVSRFAGQVGGELANVNRWRDQVGLEPIDEAKLDETVTRFGSPGREGYHVHIVGEASILVAAALHEADRNRTWFVKSVVSSPDVAERLERQIVEFAGSIGATEQARPDTE